MSENVGFAGQIGPEHVEQVVEKGKVVQNNQQVLKLKNLLVGLV